MHNRAMTHPVILIWNMPIPSASLEQAWSVFSDTDRFNRDAGLGFTFEKEQDSNGETIVTGTAKKFGMINQWFEDPFEFQAPHWLISRRRFFTGPIKTVTTHIQLLSSSKGTALRYKVTLEPRHLLLKPLVMLIAHLDVKPSIARTLRRAIAHLARSDEPWGGIPAALTEEAEMRVHRIKHLTIFPHLHKHLQTADIREQNRMRPLELAARWNIDSSLATREFAECVRAEVLQIHFDLICPSCLGASTRLTTFELDPSESHCDSCQISYDGTLPDSIEVTFSPHPDVRDINTPIDCVFSPARTPQVITQDICPAKGEWEWSGPLSSGAYWLVTSSSGGGASIEVRHGIRAAKIAVDLSENGLMPSILRVGPGSVYIAARSKSSEDTVIRLEKRWRPDHTLTAGNLLEHTTALPIIPEGLFPRGIGVETENAYVVAVDARGFHHPLALLAQQLQNESQDSTLDLSLSSSQLCFPLFYGTDEVFLAVITNIQEGFHTVRTLAKNTGLAISMHGGPVTLMNNGDGWSALGKTVQVALHNARRTGVDRFTITTELLKNKELQALLSASGLQSHTAEGETLVWITGLSSAPAVFHMPKTAGNRFVLGEELGRGGYGVVHRVFDKKTNVNLVMKSLLPEHAQKPDQVQRFLWEARIGKKINHENVVTLIEYGIDESLVWITMDELTGQDWAALLGQKGTTDWRQALHIAIGTLRGLHAAHTLGIVHRDVKPGNIFISSHPAPNHPTLIDFGLAITQDDNFENDEKICGTPRYLAPEQVELEALDGRADIYALGLVLYEALCGHPTFIAKTAHAVAFMRLTVQPTPLIERNPALPEAVSDAIMKAIELEPKDRYQNAEEMEQAFLQLL